MYMYISLRIAYATNCDRTFFNIAGKLYVYKYEHQRSLMCFLTNIFIYSSNQLLEIVKSKSYSFS